MNSKVVASSAQSYIPGGRRREIQRSSLPSTLGTLLPLLSFLFLFILFYFVLFLDDANYRFLI